MLEMFGCKWEVVKKYELSDEFMQEHNLWYRNRITLRCVEGNGVIEAGELRDFANTGIS